MTLLEPTVPAARLATTRSLLHSVAGLDRLNNILDLDQSLLLISRGITYGRSTNSLVKTHALRRYAVHQSTDA